MKRTPRGFAIYGDCKDSRGRSVRVQMSSAAGGPFAWIFCNEKDGSDAVMHMGKPMAHSPHLTRAQARRVAKALMRFADGGE